MLVREQIEKIKNHDSVRKKLATTLLADYPYAGLVSIHELASRAGFSPPSISHFVTKIGLTGYQICSAA